MNDSTESAPSLEDMEDGITRRPWRAVGTASPDVSDYLPDLDDLDMDEAAKIELLTILHDILSHFVQMGFDLKEVDPCGQLFGEFTDAASGGLDGVESGVFTTPEIPTDQSRKEDSDE
jgi:hypothetical protein